MTFIYMYASEGDIYKSHVIKTPINAPPVVRVVLYTPITGEFPSQRASNAEFGVFSFVFPSTVCWIKSRVTNDLQHRDVHVKSLNVNAVWCLKGIE